jgi:very-short-patch-repair endonuclease
MNQEPELSKFMKSAVETLTIAAVLGHLAEELKSKIKEEQDLRKESAELSEKLAQLGEHVEPSNVPPGKSAEQEEIEASLAFNTASLREWHRKAALAFLLYKSLKSSNVLGKNPFLSDDDYFLLALAILLVTDALISEKIRENYNTIFDSFDPAKVMENAIFIQNESIPAISLYTQHLRTILNKCESPLETAFLVNFTSKLNRPDLVIDMESQVNIAPYRVDFAFPTRKIAIELDGHTYHEKSVKQAVSDRKRDRYLTQQGWKVLRFHRQEIENNIESCISQLGEFLKEEN